jgi:hypothetical protein
MFGKFFKTPGTIIKQIARQRDIGTKFTKERILMIPPIFFTPAPPPRRDSFRGSVALSPATASPSTREERRQREKPEATAPPSAGVEVEREAPSPTRESAAEEASPGERTKASPSRSHSKQERRETATPPEGPEE